MKITLRPVVQEVSIKRDRPSGAFIISGSIALQTEDGFKVVERTFNSKSAFGTELPIESGDKSLTSAKSFMDDIQKDIEAAMKRELEKNLSGPNGE